MTNFAMFRRKNLITICMIKVVLLYNCSDEKIVRMAHDKRLLNNYYYDNKKNIQNEELDNASPNFRFSFEDCRNIINECDNKDIGIKNVLWSNKKSLAVEVCVNIDCGKSILTLGYDLKNDTLTLIYYVKFMRNEKNTCKYKLLYKFSNLVKKDYKIALKKIDADDRCGTPPPTK